MNVMPSSDYPEIPAFAEFIHWTPLASAVPSRPGSQTWISSPAIFIIDLFVLDLAAGDQHSLNIDMGGEL